ncbi:hypothetical protein [Methylobacterium sp. Leaf108]|uniref:hypothetical protein n=1 Tax=Methylobacterium sp. Leaf108 TaxID=1736256 RepID=UPI000726DB49|nr:hypothetical protein [Methylobacterium sp. Leaf108]KQP52329.1 hypothetical protein ASF39_20070 [Methylobacterium sp. Leaf108]
MADDPIETPDNDSEGLSFEWAETAINASHNLGFKHELPALSSEHWQMVLTSVAARMQMRGIRLPFGWKKALARQVGRREDG